MDYFIGAPNNTLVHYIWHHLTDHNNMCYMLESEALAIFKREEQGRNRFLITLSLGKLADKVGIYKKLFYDSLEPF